VGWDSAPWKRDRGSPTRANKRHRAFPRRILFKQTYVTVWPRCRRYRHKPYSHSRLRPNPSPLLTCRLKATSLRRYLDVVRPRHSAVIAANKLSVAKRTGKFSTWCDDAATQQVAANRERTVSSNTDARIVACASLRLRLMRDGSHQRRGVDLICHGSLCHIDDCEEQELRVVEDRETLHLGGGKRE
jgi:hypothetical protein